MSTRRTILSAAAAAICTALCVSAAHADKMIFKDVLKPNGQTRGEAAKTTDLMSCGMSKNRAVKVVLPVFEKCMAGKGWAFDHLQRNTPRPRYGTRVNFIDVQGDATQHERSNAVFAADSRTCVAGYRDQASKIYKQCMAAHGWQYMYTQHAPVRHYWAVAPYESGYPQWGSSGSSSGANLDDEMRHIDESNAATQAASDAINASIAATNAQQAADQIQQSNIINNQ
jgi:hypothetical protein